MQFQILELRRYSELLMKTGFPVVTTRWVADTVEMERRPVHQRLEELHEQGELERGKLSPRVVIWWIPEEE
jgi:predicted transcriptional regulator of viral defense system